MLVCHPEWGNAHTKGRRQTRGCAGEKGKHFSHSACTWMFRSVTSVPPRKYYRCM
ncbi:Uncharacterized protein APZ42_019632 [Daphnia magna]|uniref:Uncharacterized protein n=1 Tax=Daphnia magna TaxID=35525 RepID=A0A0P5XD33_9CRUS|nr:Uncharacterized protein APZ42_019632 [Daphnia magna]